MVHPVGMDLAWATGFLDGEGAFYTRLHTGRRARYYSNIRVEANQKAPELLHGLVQLFGGKVAAHKAVWRWYVSGPRAAGVMMTLYSFPILSAKRKKQIRKALVDWKAHNAVNQYA
jgi:hypothetical protein